MTTTSPRTVPGTATTTDSKDAAAALSRWRALAAPVSLFILGLATQLAATLVVNQPLTEASSYYVSVARNLVLGRGLVIDVIWSYATPPLTLPRPAFEIWQPMASLIAAVPMTLIGPTFHAAQLGFVLLGATLAPLAWLVARDAARRLDLPERRTQAVTSGAGVLTALSTPLLLSAAAPDSTLPFTVTGVVACLIMPRALAGDRRALAGLGVVLGLAYLTRMEAAWFGLAFVLASLWLGNGVRRTAVLVVAVASVAALVALPWWLRDIAVFGKPLPGQVADNLFFTSNLQVFSYDDRPTLDAFLAQGLPTLLGNIGRALWHDLVDVLIVPTGPIAALGLLTVAVGLRRRNVRPAGSLALLFGAGALTYAATSVLFPVATLWGTFEHAAGPLHIALIVAGLMGADAFVARVRQWRRWPRANAWLAPAGLAVIGLPIAALALAAAASNASTDAQRIDQIARADWPAELACGGCDGPYISDRPIWLSDATRHSVIALPDEPVDSIAKLAREFHASYVVVTEPRGDFPAALRAPDAQACFIEQHLAGLPAESSVFVVNEACR
jgi:hypothetical protein